MSGSDESSASRSGRRKGDEKINVATISWKNDLGLLKVIILKLSYIFKITGELLLIFKVTCNNFGDAMSFL